MSDITSIASSAVSAYQRALATVSNNIANAATTGYSREVSTLQANPISKSGQLFMGTGVNVAAIARQYDAFLQSNVRNSNSDYLSQQPMVDYTNRIVNVMGSSTMGLSSALDNFFNSAQQLSTDPASSALRGSFISDASGVSSRFNELSGQLDLIQNETTQAVNTDVGQINTITSALAQVNNQLAKQKSVSDQPADLLDQRDTLLKNLSDYAHVNAQFADNGTVSVSLGPSFSRDVVVSGSKALNIGANYNSSAPEKVSLVLDPNGVAQPLTSITSGKLAGLLSFREQVLGSSRASLDSLATTFAQEVNKIQSNGIDAYGNVGTQLFTFDPNATSPAAGMQMAISDPQRIATASQFRIANSATNTSDAQTTVAYAPVVWAGPASVVTGLGNSAKPQQTFTTTPSHPFAAVATIPNGLQNVNLYMQGAQGQNLQVFTRDGQHILGSPLNPDQLSALVTTDNGFNPGAEVGSQYLNQSGSNGYKDMTVFYGARADVTQQAQWDMSVKDPTVQTPLPPKNLPALLQGGSIPTGMTGTIVGNGSLVLNGQSLGALTVTSGKTLQAKDVSAWINNAHVSGVTATASNILKFTPAQISFGKPLVLNGQTITTGVSNVKDLAAAINSSSSTTNLTATFDADGNLLITNAVGHAGEDIVVSGSIPNALGLANGTYTGQVSITRDLVPGTDTPIELGFSGTGTPAGTPDDLSKLGFNTGAYLNGKANEDLLVFVTGNSTSTSTARIGATFSGAPIDPKQDLRQTALQIKFDAANHYTIWDTQTNTEVASHAFDPSQLNPGISYQGLKVNFTAPPQANDVYTIDGNLDGTGNNQNMLDMVDLQKANVVGGSKTLNEAYIDQVNDMGNIASQATISQSALKVVNDQAVSANDQVSGVSMDQEATDLIRFQQAYQASAKVMQVASAVFQSILQVQ
jgi:flagellar hook-associated protein FlgK